MPSLNLEGMLKLAGMLNLVGTDGGKVTVKSIEVLVETTKGVGESQGKAVAPVLIPPPPAAPSDPGLDVWIFKSFNSTVTAVGIPIVTQGMCAQGNPAMASWPGIVQPSVLNTGVSVNGIFINVVGDMGITLPSGAPVTFTSSGQQRWNL
jgi:hypothetical protein